MYLKTNFKLTNIAVAAVLSCALALPAQAGGAWGFSGWGWGYGGWHGGGHYGGGGGHSGGSNSEACEDLIEFQEARIDILNGEIDDLRAQLPGTSGQERFRLIKQIRAYKVRVRIVNASLRRIERGRISDRACAIKLALLQKYISVS